MNSPSPLCRLFSLSFALSLNFGLYDHHFELSCVTDGLITLFSRYSNSPKYPPALIARRSLLIYVRFTIWGGIPVYKKPSFSAPQPVFIKNVYSVFFFPFRLEKKAVFWSASQRRQLQSSKNNKNSVYALCDFRQSLKSPLLNYRCEKEEITVVLAITVSQLQ